VKVGVGGGKYCTGRMKTLKALVFGSSAFSKVNRGGTLGI
jgi:hypothetical protein